MEIYESHKMEDPRLPFILHNYHYVKGQSLGFGNWHENVELLYVADGYATVTVNAEEYPLRAGELAVINANCIHDILAVEDTHFYCLIVDRSFCLSNHFDTGRIRFQTRVTDREIGALILTFAKEYETPKDPYRIPLLRSAALRIMALLCSRYGTAEQAASSDTARSSAIRLALDRIHAESRQKLSLECLAETAGLSKYYFAREFRRVTGYTTVSYINHVRCEQAKRLLLENKLTVLAIAEECGFPNASYFTRTFLSIVGMRPTEYRAAARKGMSDQKQIPLYH